MESTFLACKNYQRYQFTKLKQIDGEIFNVNKKDKKSFNYKLKTITQKKGFINKK